MKRFAFRDEIHRLDAEADCVRIMQILNAHEFPWDMGRALGIALRTPTPYPASANRWAGPTSSRATPGNATTTPR